MTTIPTRLAKLASPSSSIAEARRRSINAYRAWYRSIVALYALNISPSWVRLKIRQDFERNRAINDLKIIDMLLLKNQQEFQETMNCWKQEPHLMHWFKQYEDPQPPQTFLDKFYAGRDDPKQVSSF
ncbi:hypothetical protein EHS25_004346 [Saitozyma podzolica]|uniref:Uncharacterized protein n=1 Tax=Saitozyma podzolica TaxID=1890683 RepID=A0A427YTY5_9TREE|nr:hypothetical protein EHS25_004346 [Saitozyma podzolica]